MDTPCVSHQLCHQNKLRVSNWNNLIQFRVQLQSTICLQSNCLQLLTVQMASVRMPVGRCPSVRCPSIPNRLLINTCLKYWFFVYSIRRALADWKELTLQWIGCVCLAEFPSPLETNRSIWPIRAQQLLLFSFRQISKLAWSGAVILDDFESTKSVCDCLHSK